MEMLSCRRREFLPPGWRARLILSIISLCWLLASPTLPGAPDDSATATHVVRSGDTVPRLCWQYKVRAEAIRTANPGVDDPLPVGRKLKIPLGHYVPPVQTTAAVQARTPSERPAASPTSSPTPHLASAFHREESSPRTAPTTRLPPQPAETPPPARHPVTVISAESPRP